MLLFIYQKQNIPKILLLEIFELVLASLIVLMFSSISFAFVDLYKIFVATVTKGKKTSVEHTSNKLNFECEIEDNQVTQGKKPSLARS